MYRQGTYPFQTVKEASQSLRSQAQRKWKSFSPAACTSEKIPLGSQTCALCAVSAQCVRCREPQPFQTKAQRSGFRLRACQKRFFDKPKGVCTVKAHTPFLSAAPVRQPPFDSFRKARFMDRCPRESPVFPVRARSSIVPDSRSRPARARCFRIRRPRAGSSGGLPRSCRGR